MDDHEKASTIHPMSNENDINTNNPHFASSNDKESNENSILCSEKYKYAAIDIIQNDEERNIIKKDKKRRQKYEDDLYLFFHKYSKYYNERRELNELNSQPFLNDPHSQKVRSNIRILIIVGSSPVFKDLGLGRNYYENSEDYTTAFLISHLFHYAFLIPYSQILITSSKEDVFLDEETGIGFNEMDEETKKTKFFDLSFQILFKDFGFYQNVNYSQVGNKQFKFLLESSLLDRIKPFNSYIIEQELKPEQESDIFLFFIDHGSPGFFGGLEYRFFIDELIKLKFNHFYVMNDSCNSGSLIEMIKNSINFENIFLNKLDSDFEYSILKYLFEYGTDSEQNLNQSILKIRQKDDKEIDETQKKVRETLRNMNSDQISTLIEFVNNISNVFPTGVCAFIPKNFVLFGKKATIFSSSDYQTISLSLPGRKISTSLIDNYRICGSIFSSIFIESLLKENSSLETFKSSIKELYQKYKDDFQEIIKIQNKNLQDNIPNQRLVTDEQIIQFFDMKDFDEKHFFFNEFNQWPDLKSILITDQNLWNVDSSIVDTNEYINVFFCYLKKESSIKENLNDYGPIRGMSSIIKFQMDFEKAVNQILQKDNSVNIIFSVNQPTKDELNNEYKKLWYGNWAKFVISIQQYITSNSGYGISTLKYPIAIFFHKYPNYDKKKGLQMFLDAFQTIFPFWKDQSIYN